MQTCWFDPWSRILLIHLSIITLVWLYSLRTIPSTGTSDPSIVDRLWSNLPYIYCWMWAYTWPSSRMFIMATCATAWGMRLTYNFILKGGFSGGEDYRWVEVRKWFVGAPWYFHFELFNALFVVLFQLLVVLGFTSPAALAAYDSAAPLGPLDYLAIALFATFFVIETVADYQMYVYQTEKYRRKNAGEPAGEYARGFIETGLWAYSRHPNYFGELVSQMYTIMQQCETVLVGICPLLFLPDLLFPVSAADGRVCGGASTSSAWLHLASGSIGHSLAPSSSICSSFLRWPLSILPRRSPRANTRTTPNTRRA